MLTGLGGRSPLQKVGVAERGDEMAVGVAPPCLPLTAGNHGGIVPTHILRQV
ncbi:hypothetical protein [Phormidesmis priestleyi]|uniref:hypothetical protein n=1 Tax=Phormidesmis priestleyi TaxID=268141 RepID=UPI000A67E519|nr:hypothetical protein [Phormidesmis priestleyi]